MELFGILFSVPVALILSMVYCRLLAKAVQRLERVGVCRDHRHDRPFLATVARRWGRMRRWLYSASLVLLGLFSVELIRLVTLGAVRSRAVVGPGFYVAHSVFFFLGTPALANALVLGARSPFVTKWRVAATICTIFSLFLVLLQYGVSEALYGLDSTNGPYS